MTGAMTSLKNGAKKIAQSDLRRLMSAQKRKTQEVARKIESPLAKYSELGVLSCIVCDSALKSEALWNVHIGSKQHRDNIARRKQAPAPPPVPPPPVPVIVEDNAPPPKRLKSILKNAPPVPSDFFDNATTSAPAEAVSEEVPGPRTEQEVEPMEVNEIEEPAPELPEGFFDNPVLDAKARNVEYKDPIQEEWERFQKEIKEETSLSAQIIHDDTEDSTTQRQIEEIDEQLRKLSRVVELEQKKEKVKATALTKPKNLKEEERSSDDDSDFEVEFDWRAKKFLC